MGLLKTGWKYIAQEKGAAARPLVGHQTQNSTGQELGNKQKGGPSTPVQTPAAAPGLWRCWSEALGAHPPYPLDVSFMSEKCIRLAFEGSLKVLVIW